MSENDWIVCNRFQIHTVSVLYIQSDYIKISDHIPVSVELELSLDISLPKTKQNITDKVAEPNNHSKKPTNIMNHHMKYFLYIS